MFLLDLGADINVPCSKGVNALIYAVVTGKEKIVSTLIKHKANIDLEDKNKDTLLNIDTDRGYVSIARHLIQFRAKIDVQNKFYYTPLINSVLSRSIAMVIFLLEAGTSMDYNNFY